MKTLCPAGCGKKFISAEFANAHADREHPDWKLHQAPKRKGWATPHGFVDFRDPVTYEEACEAAQFIVQAMRVKKEENHG